MTSSMNMAGARYGLLVGVRPRDSGSNRYWLFRCDCGREKEIIAANVRSGNTTSCGCVKRQMMVERNTTHGSFYTPTHAAWRGMWGRCRERDTYCASRYHERGIDVCDRWKDFANFLADMGKCPPGLTLERQNNDRGYEPDNCCWGTRIDQARNRCTTLWVIEGDERYTLSEYARKIRASRAWLSLTYRAITAEHELDAQTLFLAYRGRRKAARVAPRRSAVPSRD